jgi:hypothetical protein
MRFHLRDGRRNASLDGRVAEVAWRVDSGDRRSSLGHRGGSRIAVQDPKQTDAADIQSNLIEIRHYLNTHVRSTGQDNAGSTGDEPPVWDAYRHAEYSDGRRPRFSATDLILIGLLLGLAGLVGVFFVY